MSIMDELKKLTRPYDDDDSALLDDDMDLDDGLDEPVYTAPRATAQQQAVPQMDNTMNMNMGMNMGGMQAAPVQEAPRPAANMNMGMGMGMAMGAPDITKYRVVLVQPEQFDCATPIANHLRKGNAVILNCESTDKDVARRVVDFLSGCAYALDGSIKKAANNVYILVPREVGVDEAKDTEEA